MHPIARDGIYEVSCWKVAVIANRSVGLLLYQLVEQYYYATVNMMRGSPQKNGGRERESPRCKKVTIFFSCIPNYTTVTNKIVYMIDLF